MNTTRFRAPRPSPLAAVGALLVLFASTVGAQVIGPVGTPAASFFPAQSVPLVALGAAAPGAVDVGSGDIDGDGFIDMVTANSLGGGFPVVFATSVTVARNLGGTTTPGVPPAFATGVTSVALPGAGLLNCLAVGDFNGDGRDDVAVLRNTQPNATVVVLNGQIGGTVALGVSVVVIGAISPLAGAQPAHHLVAGDLDGDGDADLAVATAQGIQVLEGSAAGLTSAGVIRGPAAFGLAPGTAAVAVKIIVSGGVPIIAGLWNPAGAPAQLTTLQENFPVAAFPAPATTTTPLALLTATAMTVAELGGGFSGTDIAVHGTIAGPLSAIEIVDGTGVSAAPLLPSFGFFATMPATVPARDLESIDVDHDGFFDLVVETAPGSGMFNVIRNSRSSVPFLVEGPFALTGGSTGVMSFDASSDFDNDGFADVVGSAAGSAAASLLAYRYTAWSVASTLVGSGCPGGTLAVSPMAFNSNLVATYDGFAANGNAYLIAGTPVTLPSGCTLVVDPLAVMLWVLNLDVNGDVAFPVPFNGGSNYIASFPASAGLMVGWQVLEPGFGLSNGVVNALGY